MLIHMTRLQILGAAIALLASTTHALADLTISTLVSFSSAIGDRPQGGLTLSADGKTLYGTTGFGGAYDHGTVFSVPITGGSPTTLASFSGTNGDHPYGCLTISGNTLYGTTWGGGTSGLGNVFSVPITGGTPTNLASFNGSNGAYPQAGLTVSGNTLYGTTWGGGTSSSGTVFSVPITGGSPTVLASFNGANGANPWSTLILSSGTLFGTTTNGGANNDGTVFSLPITGGSPTVLASFNDANGQDPRCGMTLSHDGNTLYGTTAGGGSGDYGIVFSLPVSGGIPSTLAYFHWTDGAYPRTPLALSTDGNTLYGTTFQGGANAVGTVFSVPVTGGLPTTLALFNGTNGSLPEGRLTLAGNTLYGTTWQGGTDNIGTVFSLALPTPEPASLALLTLGAAALLTRRRR